MRFDMYHPFINLIFFVSVIYYTVTFSQPVFVAIGFVVGAIYLIWLKRLKGAIFVLCMLVLGAVYAGIYTYYNHYGVTVLSRNIIDNAITKEVLCYAIVSGIKVSSFFIWFAIINEIFTTDKVIYLVGRIWPKGALFISIFLRNIPRIRQRIKLVLRARHGIGRKKFFSVIWIVLTYTIENIIDISNSMRSRGMTLKHRKTYSIYRFENKDRCIIVIYTFILTALFLAISLGQTSMMFNPQIIMWKNTVGLFFFYTVYTVYLILPMLIEIAGRSRMTISRCAEGR